MADSFKGVGNSLVRIYLDRIDDASFDDETSEKSIIVDPIAEEIKHMAAKNADDSSSICTFGFKTNLSDKHDKSISDAFFNGSSNSISAGLKEVVGILQQPENDYGFFVMYVGLFDVYVNAIATANSFIDMIKWRDRFKVSGLKVLHSWIDECNDATQHETCITIRREREGLLTYRILCIFHINSILNLSATTNILVKKCNDVVIKLEKLKQALKPVPKSKVAGVARKKH